MTAYDSASAIPAFVFHGHWWVSSSETVITLCQEDTVYQGNAKLDQP